MASGGSIGIGTTTPSSTLQVNGSLAVGVTLVAFAAERLGPDGQLTWTTASELNNAYFEVANSVDGIRFQALGRISGVGTSSQAHQYQFTDKNLARYAASLVYYRLRQVDSNGTSTYSPVRTVQVPLDAGLLVQAYPNPSALGQNVTLSVRTSQAGAATVQLTDVLGRIVGAQQVPLPVGTSSVPLLEGRQLAIGVYVLRVQQAGRIQSSSCGSKLAFLAEAVASFHAPAGAHPHCQ